MILDPDDLEIGKLVAVYDSDESRELRGASLQITAINLPFIVTKPLCRPDYPPITLDVRYSTFMPVSEEFAKAQAVPPQQQES